MTTQHDERAELIRKLQECRGSVKFDRNSFDRLVLKKEQDGSINQVDRDELKRLDDLLDYIDALPDAAALLEADSRAGGEAELHEKVKWGAQTYGPLLRAAIDLLASVDARHEESGALKYTIPYGAVNALRDAINSHPQPQAVAQGWKLVPVEPTAEMLKAADDGDDEYTLRNFGPDCQRVMQGPYDHYVAMLSASPASPAAAQVAQPLTVWFDQMPESNGKRNWTVMLRRKDSEGLLGSIASGVCFERTEYYDRARYAADQLRFLIGELAKEPDILDYDPDILQPEEAHGLGKDQA